MALLAGAADAAVLQGVVLDSETGHPLARTLLTLAATQGTSSDSPTTARTDPYGAFVFTSVSPGAYLLSAARPGFAAFHYGASCWNCPGAPIYISGDERLGVDVKMRRLAAITGTLWDENQVGIPNMLVLAFTATRPLERAGFTTTDDRGFFRLRELPPGRYYVRTAARVADDGMSYLATFYPDSSELTTAHQVQIDLEHTATDINFKPTQGKLYRITGKLVAPPPIPATSIDLISDAGRVSAPVAGDGSFAFDAVAPGPYEIYSEGRNPAGHFAAWTRIVVEHEMEISIQMYPLYPAYVSVTDEVKRPVRENVVSIRARRKDLDGEGPPQTLRLSRTELAPGNWEIEVITPADMYAVSVTAQGTRAASRRPRVAEGWNLLTLGNGYNQIQVSVSTKTATLAGHVTVRPNEVAPIAPVFLETLDLDPPDPPILRRTYTDQNGAYQFAGLPPGRYRAIASFDLDGADRYAVDNANPVTVTITEGARAGQDLVLYKKGN